MNEPESKVAGIDALQPTMILAGKRVIFVFVCLELGGAEHQGFLLARHLFDKYHAEVQVIGLKGEPGRLAELCKEAGIPCRSLFLGQMYTNWERLSALFCFTWRMFFSRPHLIISYTRSANVLSALAWKVSRASGFIWNQADDGLGMGREIVSRLAVKFTPQFISNSVGGQNFLQRTYAVPDERLHLIRNGILLRRPLASRQEWRQKIGVGVNDFVACMVANISQFKDHATLIRGWRYLLDLVAPQRPVLLLAGRFDGPEKELFMLADELGLGDRVKFLNAVTDVSGLLGAVNLFVYSSKSEGLPNAVVEAMAAGLPVVGTDIPGIREAVGKEGDDFLSPVGDPVALALCVSRCIQSPLLCHEYGEKLRVRAISEFSLETMLDTTVDICCKQLQK